MKYNYSDFFNEIDRLCATQKLADQSYNLAFDAFTEGLGKRKKNFQVYDCCFRIFGGRSDKVFLDELILYAHEFSLYAREASILPLLTNGITALLKDHYGLSSVSVQSSWFSFLSRDTSYKDLEHNIELIDSNQMKDFRDTLSVIGFNEQIAEFNQRFESYKKCI